MSFTNVYYKRTAGTPRACYVCNKPTPIVLATINTVDFLYTCETHLSDRNFASRIDADPPAKPAVSPEEIARVKKDWEAAQKAKAENAKDEKDKDKDKDNDTDSKKDAKDGKEKPSMVPGSLSPDAMVSPPASAPATPSHEKYALHRDMFTMRQTEHRRRRQAAQAKELAPRLPGAPKFSFPAPPP